MDLDIEKMSNKEICSTLGITMGQLTHAHSRKKLPMVEAVCGFSFYEKKNHQPE